MGTEASLGVGRGSRRGGQWWESWNKKGRFWGHRQSLERVSLEEELSLQALPGPGQASLLQDKCQLLSALLS